MVSPSYMDHFEGLEVRQSSHRAHSHDQEMMKAATIGRSSEFGGGWEPPGMVCGCPVVGAKEWMVVCRSHFTSTGTKHSCLLGG